MRQDSVGIEAGRGGKTTDLHKVMGETSPHRHCFTELVTWAASGSPVLTCSDRIDIYSLSACDYSSSFKTLIISIIIMKAAQFFGQRDIRVVDVPRPEPKVHEALVDIEWCGICGSDLHEYLIGSLLIIYSPDI